MKILILSTEAIPFIKIGGLADVVGALAVELSHLEHEVKLVLPKYAAIQTQSYKLKLTNSSISIPMGNCNEKCAVYELVVNKKFKVYFIENDIFFGRQGIYYDDTYTDYKDNAERFAFFSNAALSLCEVIQFRPDIVNSHDWFTALSCAYLKTQHSQNSFFSKSLSVLTIHNIRLQGICSKDIYEYLGLGWHNFKYDKFEHFNNVNILKGSIFFADAVTTVSKHHASEILHETKEMWLSQDLKNKGNRFIGITNGIDYSIWSPNSDNYLPATYSPSNLQGKKICKDILQMRLGIKQNNNICIIGIISRLIEQKGFHLLSDIFDRLIDKNPIQFVVLGSGDRNIENIFDKLKYRYPDSIGCYFGYNNELAHLIYAGSDFLLIPSVFEPCGLSQLFALKYGTIPIVNPVGGLVDTINNYAGDSQNATGFIASDVSSSSLYYTITWAASIYYNNKLHYMQMVQNAMHKDFSIQNTAKEYSDLFNKLVNNKPVSIVEDYYPESNHFSSVSAKSIVFNSEVNSIIVKVDELVAVRDGFDNQSNDNIIIQRLNSLIKELSSIKENITEPSIIESIQKRIDSVHRITATKTINLSNESKYVFISYVKEDKETVMKIATFLKAYSVEYWLDDEKLMGGDKWENVIADAITAGRYFMPCFSKSYEEKTRNYMNRELKVAELKALSLNENIRFIIPVILSPCRELPRFFKQFQYIDLSKKMDDGLNNIIKCIIER